MKLGKKLLSALMVSAMAISLYSVPAYADKHYYSFSVTSQNDKAFSAGNPKTDNEARSYVRVQDGNIVSSDLFYLAVYDRQSSNSNYRYTNYKRITDSNNVVYNLDYTQYVYQGKIMYLGADTDKHQVSINGYWFS